VSPGFGDSGRIRPRLLRVAALFALACMGTPAAAAPADSSEVRSSHLVITEVGVGTVFVYTHPGMPRATIDVQLGYLQRTGKQSLLGAEVALLHYGEGGSIAVRPRIRGEIDRNWAVNFAAGPILSGSAYSRRQDGLGVSVAAGLDYRGFGGVSVEVQSAHYSHYDPYWQLNAGPFDGRVTTAHIGVRAGKGPGMVATVVLVMLAAQLASDLRAIGNSN
jgi:hypothetical protein